MGAIGNRESENYVVWITLQSPKFNWKKEKIPKVKGDGTDTMYILNNNPKHREKFLQLDTVQDIVTKTSVPIVVMLPSILGPIYVVRKIFMGVAHNCEIMGVAKVQGGKTSCPPYY